MHKNLREDKYNQETILVSNGTQNFLDLQI